MKHILIILTAIVFVAQNLNAQTTEDSVKATVDQLFYAMKNSDPIKLKEVFSDSAILQTIGRTKNGDFRIINEDVDDFVKSIARLPKDSADERITYESIKIDGPLASVWTPYKFYYAGKFSHCGVNSFQLIKINNRWKIQYLIDTRRRQDCE